MNQTDTLTTDECSLLLQLNTMDRLIFVLFDLVFHPTRTGVTNLIYLFRKGRDSQHQQGRILKPSNALDFPGSGHPNARPLCSENEFPRDAESEKDSAYHGPSWNSYDLMDASQKCRTSRESDSRLHNITSHY
jgi:hypothetical protein